MERAAEAVVFSMSDDGIVRQLAEVCFGSSTIETKLKECND